MGRPPQIGLIGARRIHQGLGPFIARDLASHGAEVAMVLGRTAESAKEAAREIEARTGIRPRATAEQDTFLAADLDAVCVLTPKGSHGALIEASLSAGRHVLCEKPVFWHPETGDWGAAARDLEDRFAATGLVFAVNAQWPWAIPAFEDLHGAVQKVPRSLAMGLAPASIGREMIGDAAPHPLSLAQALRPDLERLTAVTFGRREPSALDFTAILEGEHGPLELRVELGPKIGSKLSSSGAPPPREAWFAIDGKRADRCVRASDYALFLRDGARIVDLPDPLTGRIAAFVQEVQSANAAGRPRRAPDRTSSRRAEMLAVLDAAFVSQD